MNNIVRNFFLIIFLILILLFSCSAGTTDESDSVSSNNTGTSSTGDAYESDNTSGTAKVITVGAAAQSHTLHTTTDEDWLYFNAAAGTNYRITITRDLNTYMDVYDESDLTDYFDYTSKTVFTVFSSTNKKYYFAIYSSEVSKTGSYTVSVNTVSIPDADAYESDNDYSTSNELVENVDAQTHSLHTTTDEDWLFFHAESGQTYTVTAKDYNGSTDENFLNFNLYYTSDLVNPINEGRIGSPIVFNSLSTTTLVIKVVPKTNRLESYTIELAR